MNVQALIRDPGLAKEVLVTLPDKKVVAKVPCKIIVPCRFIERGLAYVGVDNYIVGVCALVVGDRYCISTVNAMYNIEPTSTTKIKIKGDDHFEFFFEAGSTVIKTISLVKMDVLVYKIYDEIFSKGYVPWYLSYEDLGRIFNTARKHAGAKIGTNKEVTELVASIVARNPKDKTIYYRTQIQSLKDMTSNPPEFIPLRDVTYAATNTTNRLGGSHTRVGIVAALNNPADRTERIESLLKA